jgi:hypothetical protein
VAEQKLDYGRPAAPPPPDKWAVGSGWVSLGCLVVVLARVRLFERPVPAEHWKYFFIFSLVGVLAGMICVDRANGRLATGWLGLLLNAGVAGILTLFALVHG